MKTKLSLTILALLPIAALPLPAVASLQPIAGGSLQVTYSQDVANWMVNSTLYDPPYQYNSFFDASYNIAQQDAYGGGFAMTANPFLAGSPGWDQTFNFSFNLSHEHNPNWRSTIQQTNTFLVEYDDGTINSTGALGLSGALRVDNGAQYAVYGDFLLSQTAPSTLSLDNYMGFYVPDAFRMVIDESQTIYSGNTVTLFGDFTYGNLAVSYFFQGYAGPELGNFQLTLEMVPEPSSSALILSATAAMILSRRRRKKAFDI